MLIAFPSPSLPFGFLDVVCVLEIIIIIIIIILHLWEFSTPALVDGFSVKLEWLQVSSSLLNSSQYSGRS